MKAVDVKSSTYIDFAVKNSGEGPKFEVGHHVRISKYKNIIAKDHIPICPKKILWLKKLKILYRGHM